MGTRGPRKGRGDPAERQAGKRAAVLGDGKKRSFPWFLVAGGAACALVLGFVLSWPLGKASSPVITGDQIIFPVDLFKDGRALHFQMKADDGITVKYFVLRSSDGIIRAAFDACDVCWPAGKGYYQDGDYMVCRNCGQRFASVRVNELKGGCNPAPLAREVRGDKLIIKIRDVMEGKPYFNLPLGG